MSKHQHNLKMEDKYHFEVPEKFPSSFTIICPTSIDRISRFTITENGSLLLILAPIKVFTGKVSQHRLIINNGENVDKYRHLGVIKINDQRLSVWLENIT